MSDENKADGLKPTTAIQVQNEDGSTHVVGIGNLRVHLFASGAFWIAQGLEIDYVAQGNSPDEAKKNFEDGLNATLDQNLEAFGTIEPLLEIASSDVWNRAVRLAPQLHVFSQVSIHQCEGAPINGLAPWFSKIDYLSQATAA